MSDHPLRARSVTEIVDALIQLYRRHALQFILVSALVYAPWLVVQIIFFRGMMLQSMSPTAGSTGLFLTSDYWLNFLGTFIAFSAMTGVLIKTASRAFLYEQPADLGTAVRDAMPKVPWIILGGILRVLAICVAGIPMFLGFLNPLFVVVGTFAMLIGVPYLFAMFVAVVPVIVLEDRNAFEAMARSRALTRGRKWHALGTYLLLGLIYMVLGFGMLFAVALLQSPILTLVLSTALGIVVYPAFSLTEMLLYYDMRVRNEGYDLEMMAASLDSPAAAAH